MNLPYFEDEQAKKIQIEILSICKNNLTISADFEQIIYDFLFGVMTCYKQEYTIHYCQSVQNHLNQCGSNEFLLKAFILIKIPLLLNSYFNYLDNNQRLLCRFEDFLWSIQQLINKIIYQHECFKNEIFRMAWLIQLETITKQMMIEGTIHQLSFNQDNAHYIKSFLQKISQVNDIFLIDNFVNDFNVLLDESDPENFILTTKKLLKIPYQVAKYFKQGYEKDKAIYSQDNNLFISAYFLGEISYSLLKLIMNHHYFHSVSQQEVLFETIANELINNRNLLLGSSLQFPSHLLFVWIQILFELQKKIASRLVYMKPFKANYLLNSSVRIFLKVSPNQIDI